MTTTNPRCPICSRPLAAGGPQGIPANFPFCSERCRLLDLGRWLDGHYRIPGSPVSISEEDGGRARRPEDSGEGSQA
jgi:hypothetical protein